MHDISFSPVNCHLVTSFTGEQCQGNQHLVFVETTSISPQLYVCQTGCRDYYVDISLKLSPYIIVFLCLSENKNDGKTRAGARFFQNGREILRCGSGSVAVAYTLFKIRAHNKPGDAFCSLVTPGGKVEIGCKNNEVFYLSPVLPLFTSYQKRAWGNVINKPIKDVILVGSEKDYCILELYNRKAVKQCIINTQQLIRLSRRAVIVTALGEHWKHDYVMRYFTPQYGQYEDKATGSANAMLAPYWQDKLAKTNVRSRQLSTAGGMLRIEPCGKRQRVFGKAGSQALPVNIKGIVDRIHE